MRNIFLIVFVLIMMVNSLTYAEGLIYIKDTAEVSTTPDLWSEVISYLAYAIAMFILGRIIWLFGWLSVKFPKLASIFIEFQQVIRQIVEEIERDRKSMPEVLTAKQGIELKTRAVDKVMQTKPANELRRGVANIFGIFGGRAKEMGKELFDSAVPGLIDKQVSKITSKIK